MNEAEALNRQENGDPTVKWAKIRLSSRASRPWETLGRRETTCLLVLSWDLPFLPLALSHPAYPR